MDSAVVPTKKLRRAKRRRFTMGCFSVSSQARKKAKDTTAITVSTTICVDANQSSSLPLSIMICMLPTNSTSRPRPT